jgi:uncharacterized protein
MKKNKLLLVFLVLLFSGTILLTACNSNAPAGTPQAGSLVQATIRPPTFAPTPPPGTTPDAVVVAVPSNAPIAPTPTPVSASPANVTPQTTPHNAAKEIKCLPNLPCQQRLTTVYATLKARDGKEVTVAVELARTSQEQQTGLMGRAEMGANEGMLFIFQNKTFTGFYMRNTALPLSIAFIDEKGVIVDIKDMQPYDERTVSPSGEYLLALEMNQGFFTRNNLVSGDTFKLKG